MKTHTGKHMCDYDSNPKDYVYLQLVDFVYVYLLVYMWVMCVCLFCLLYNLKRALGSWIQLVFTPCLA